MTTPLQQAAQAMIDRWDSPPWKDQPHTAEYVNELRKALDAEIAQSAEPVLYQRRMQADWHTGGNWTAWDDCSEATFKQVLIVPSLHGWTHQARALYLHPPQPQTVPSGEREVLLHALSGHIGWANTVGYAELGKSLRKAADMLEADAHQVAVPTATAEICTVMQQALDALQELWLLGDRAAAIANPAIESLKFAISQPPARPLENAEIDLLGVSGIEQFPALYNRVPWGGELMMYVRQLARAIEAHHGVTNEQK